MDVSTLQRDPEFNFNTCKVKTHELERRLRLCEGKDFIGTMKLLSQCFISLAQYDIFGETHGDYEKMKTELLAEADDYIAKQNQLRKPADTSDVTKEMARNFKVNMYRDTYVRTSGRKYVSCNN